MSVGPGSWHLPWTCCSGRWIAVQGCLGAMTSFSMYLLSYATLFFFGTGAVVLKQVGSWDWSRLKISANTPASWSAQELRIGPGNPSGPVTFHMFILGNGRSNVTHEWTRMLVTLFQRFRAVSMLLLMRLVIGYFWCNSNIWKFREIV